MIILNNNFRSIFFFLFCLVLLLLNSTVFSTIEFFYFSGMHQNPIQNESMAFRIAIGVILTPIVETYVFQSLPNLIMNKIKVKNIFLRIVIPSLIFALSHNFNVIYICMAFCAGLVFNCMYLTYKDNNNKYAFILVVVIHASYNFFALFI